MKAIISPTSPQVKGNYEEACFLFGDVVNQIFEPLIDITNTYRFASRALQLSSASIQAEEADNYKIYAEDPKFAEIFGHTYKEIQDNSYRERVAKSVQAQLDKVDLRIASASLVFAHAIFEKCLFDCLKIIELVAPEVWLDKIPERIIKIADLRVNSVPELLAEQISRCVMGYKEASVLKKLDAFFEITRPTKKHRKPYFYEYKREQIGEIDERRQVAAHHDTLSYPPQSLNDDVEYLRTTILYLLMILMDCYQLRNLPRP